MIAVDFYGLVNGIWNTLALKKMALFLTHIQSP